MEDHPHKDEMEMMGEITLAMCNVVCTAQLMLTNPASASTPQQQLQSLANYSISCF